MRCTHIVVAWIYGLLLLVHLPSVSSADTLTIESLTRSFHMSMTSGDGIVGSSDQMQGPFALTGAGSFDHNESLQEFAAATLIDAEVNLQHQSTAGQTPNSLDIVGAMHSTAQATATRSGINGSGASWGLETRLDITFTIDAPFRFTLLADTSHNGSIASDGTGAASYVALGRNDQFSVPGPSNPDVAAFGASTGSGGWGDTAAAESGTVSGILMPGTYAFHALLVEDGDANTGAGPASYAGDRAVSFNLSISPAGIFGDVDEDGDVDVHDIDALFDAFGTADEQADLDGSGGVNSADLDLLIRDAMDTNYGDANLDKRVNITDLSIVATNFGAADSGWAQGNFNGHGGTNITDLSLLATFFGFDHSGMMAPASSDAIPAPPACVAAMLWGTFLRLRRRPTSVPLDHGRRT